MYFQNLVRETVEFQNRNGINPLTIGFFVAIAVFIIQSWGILSQNKKIIKNETKELLPIYFFVCQLFYFGSYMVYGFDLRSATIMISNLPGLFLLLIVISLIRCKIRNIRKEKNARRRDIIKNRLKTDLIISSLLSIILSGLLVTIKNKNYLVITFLAIIMVAMVPFAINIVKRKTFKIIGIKYLAAFAISSIAWMIYGVLIYIKWGIEASGLIASGLITAVITTILIILRLRFDRKNPRE